ncbi:MAG: lipid kinase [Actinomycetota bacterium]|nr:lipid kinase [Actinomycetota bacterium]
MIGTDGPVVVVANQRAGGIQGLAEAVAVLRARVETVVVELAGPGEMEAALAGLPATTMIAAGGDGTLNMLVQHLWAQELLHQVVLGLLPLGTGNDLARGVGIPLEAEAAATVVLAGRPRPLDLLVDGAGTVAVNAVHGGIGGLVAARAARLKALLGRMAYVGGAAWTGARTPGWDVRVEVDGAVLAEGTVLFAGIGNGATIGGGTVLWPLARPDDGLAEVTVAFAGSIGMRLRMARALRCGCFCGVDGVVVGRGRSVRVDGEPMPYNADGEALAPSRSRSWRVQRRALRLLTPVRPDEGRRRGAGGREGEFSTIPDREGR